MLKILLCSPLLLLSSAAYASGSYSSSPQPAPQSFNAPAPSNNISLPNNQQEYNQQYNNHIYSPTTPAISGRQNPRQLPPNSDQYYELGKYIYTGKSKKIGKFNYCIDTGKDKSAIKETRLAQFKGQSFSDIASKLYDCDSPNIKVSSYMQEKHLGLVIYYLNKRYGMGLQAK